jgi:hypothetical protein
MTPKFEKNEAIKFVSTVEGRYTLGDEGRIDSSYDNGKGEFFYVIKSAGVSIPDVPESDIEAVYSGIEKNVDAYLRTNEAEKKFQDSDVRIGGTRKEMAAFKGLIKLSDLSNIEVDSVTAEKLIKKDKVYPKINYNEQIEKGVSAGTLYLKDKLRESVISEPKGSKEIRAMYVGLIEWLVELVEDTKDINSLKENFSYFYKGSLRKAILIANPDLEYILLSEKKHYDDFTEKLPEFRAKVDEFDNLMTKIRNENFGLNFFELRELEEYKKVEEEYKYWRKMVDLAWSYKSNQILPIEYKFLQQIQINDYKKGKTNILGSEKTYSDEDYIKQFTDGVKHKLLSSVFGDKFYDFIRQIESRDFVEKAYSQAFLYEPYSQDEYELAYENFIKPKEIKFKKYQEWVNFLSDEDKSLKEKIEYAHKNTDMGGWHYGNSSSNNFNKLYNKGDIQEMSIFIRRMVSNNGGYINELNESKNELEQQQEKYKVRENDYSWIEDKGSKNKDKKTKPKSELKINTATPLSHIKRIGGIAVFDEDLDDGEKLLSFYKQNLGITRITYGKTLPDNERLAHSKHFFASLIDLSETLNFDVKSFVGLGGLGIMFAASGTAGAMAHYDPTTIALNLTRGRGDGTVAHEMAHYIDNMLAKIFPKDQETKKRSSVYGSYIVEQKLRYGTNLTQNISNENIYSAMKSLMLFIRKGVPIKSDGTFDLSEEAKKNPIMEKMLPLLDTFIKSMFETEIPIIIQASPESASNKKMLSRRHGVTIEDEIEYQKLNYPDYFSYNYYMSEKRVSDLFTAIANTYGVPSYEITLNNKPRKAYYYTQNYTNTNFYLRSSMMKSEYWTFDWELFARGFETYVFDKMAKFGRENNYLVSGGYFDRPEGVYPFGIERDILYILYDNLIDTIKNELQIPDFTPFRTQRLNEYIEINNDDTEKRKVIVDESTSAVIDAPDENSERKTLVSNKLQSLINMLTKEKFEDGGEISDMDLMKNLFNFTQNNLAN